MIGMVRFDLPPPPSHWSIGRVNTAQKTKLEKQEKRCGLLSRYGTGRLRTAHFPLADSVVAAKASASREVLAGYTVGFLHFLVLFSWQQVLLENYENYSWLRSWKLQM